MKIMIEKKLIRIVNLHICLSLFTLWHACSYFHRHICQLNFPDPPEFSGLPSRYGSIIQLVSLYIVDASQ